MIHAQYFVLKGLIFPYNSLLPTYLVGEGKEKVSSQQKEQNEEGNSGGNDYKWPSMEKG